MQDFEKIISNATLKLPPLPEQKSFYHVYRDIESRLCPSLLAKKAKELDEMRAETDNPSKMTGLYKRTSEMMLGNFVPQRNSFSKFSLCIPKRSVENVSHAFEQEYSEGFFKNSQLKAEKLKKRVIYLLSFIYFHSMNEYQGAKRIKNAERLAEDKTILEEGQIFLSQSVLRDIVSGKEGTEILHFLRKRGFININKNHSYNWNPNYSYANHPRIVSLPNIINLLETKREYTQFDDKEFCDFCWRQNNVAFLRKDNIFSYKISLKYDGIVEDFKKIEQDLKDKRDKKILEMWWKEQKKTMKDFLQGNLSPEKAKKLKEEDFKEARKSFEKVCQYCDKQIEIQLKTQKNNVINFVNGKRKLKRDEFGQRIHTNATAMKKVFRKRFVDTESFTFEQGRYEEIDIASSNIAFLQRDLYEQAKESRKFRVEQIDQEQNKMGVWLSEGFFYEKLMELIKKNMNDQTKVLDRKNLKTSIISFLNIKNKELNEFTINDDPEIGRALIKAIKEHFPVLCFYLKKLKKDNHKTIASSYQRNEAKLIKEIVKVLTENEIKVVTIHDAIYTPRGQLDVAQFIVTNLMKAHGLKSFGKVKPESWGQEYRGLNVDGKDGVSLGKQMSLKDNVFVNMDFSRLNRIKQAKSIEGKVKGVLDFEDYLKERENLSLVNEGNRGNQVKEYRTQEFIYLNNVNREFKEVISGLNHRDQFVARLNFNKMYLARKKGVDGLCVPYREGYLPEHVSLFLDRKFNSVFCKRLCFGQLDYLNGEDSKFFHFTLISVQIKKLFRKFLKESPTLRRIISEAKKNLVECPFF